MGFMLFFWPISMFCLSEFSDYNVFFCIFDAIQTGKTGSRAVQDTPYAQT